MLSENLHNLTNMLAGNIGPCTDVYLTAEWVCRELMTFQLVKIFCVNLLYMYCGGQNI